nr:PREDICTED: kelch-like protein 38 isoform X1 [Tribolium castaneum]|eukprot:XP_008197617.1 PREDICTED: kelch-like protein 38 isoform X1 [Tribolium castaneum]
MEENDDIVTLKIEETTIQCSRSDLIKHSDYFKAMFEGNFTESSKSVITLNGVEPEAVTTILKLLWDREYVIREDLALPVVQATCMLQFLGIKDICIEQLSSVLSVHNCLKIWLYSEALAITEVSLEAKLLSLLEFKTVKDSSCFLELGLNELINYVGSVYLYATSEFEVFEAIMRWYCSLEEGGLETLLKLLHCVDFNALTIGEVDKIIANPNVSRHGTLIDTLNCVIGLKKDPSCAHFNTECVNNAKSLLKSKNRNLHGYPCIFLDEFTHLHSSDKTATKFHTDQWRRKTRYNDLKDSKGSSVGAYLDLNSLEFSRFFFMIPSCDSLNGFRICGCKQFVFVYGGEYTLGKGEWNLDFRSYDVIKQSWKSQKLPFPRRHFETCVCGKYLFLVGGTGPFRVIQDNLFWYDIEEDQWSEVVQLPCEGRQLKCCPFGDKLLILNLNNKCGYLFSPELNEWSTLTICDLNNVLPAFSDDLSLFCYKSRIYIKGISYFLSSKLEFIFSEISLFELEVQNNVLVVTRNITFPGVETTELNYVESVLCNNILFLHTTTKHWNLKPNERPITMELLNLDTFELKTVDEQTHKLDAGLKNYTVVRNLAVFTVFHPNLVKENDLINQY